MQFYRFQTTARSPSFELYRTPGISVMMIKTETYPETVHDTPNAGYVGGQQDACDTLIPSPTKMPGLAYSYLSNTQ
jgi:hypothetical protein